MASLTHTSQQWDVQRPEITRLYAAQNLPLKDVVKIMKSRHSFSATYVLVMSSEYSSGSHLTWLSYSERQYKMRISQWCLDKKVKYKEMRVIIRKLQKRKIKENKATLFRVRQRPVDFRKIDRFMRDHPALQYSVSTCSE